MFNQLIQIFLSLLVIRAESTPVGYNEKPDFAKKLFERQSTSDYFSTHASSPNLVWYPCYNRLQCARLEVPLDYAKPVAGDVFKLALVKVPAETTVPYMGTVFLLQGLEPGVDFATSQPDNQHFLPEFYQMGGFHGFDIISWDWRGAGHSTPKLKCFSDAAAESAYAEVERRGLQLNSFNGSHPPTSANIRFNIQQITAHQQTFAAGCETYYGHYLPYIGTADNARDLNQIVKLIGGTTSKFMYFYGYATALGTTYASMFPNGFDRMMLDGVVNTVRLYTVGDNGPSSIIDARKAVQVFYDSCSAAGPCTSSSIPGTCCPFWAATPALVQARYEAVKGKYYYKPFKSVPPNRYCGDCEAEYYYVATGLADLIGLGPFFSDIATQQLVEWENGVAPSDGATEFFSQFTPNVTYSPYAPALMASDQYLAIQGVFAQEVYLILMNATSNQVGGLTANQELYAANWQVKLKNPYLGPIGGITKGKILFVGNTADPATPLSNAYAMSALFPKSSVVAINGLGSTSFFLGDSPCFNAYRSNFWIAGTLPLPGAFCNDIQNGLFGRPLVKDYRF